MTRFISLVVMLILAAPLLALGSDVVRLGREVPHDAYNTFPDPRTLPISGDGSMTRRQSSTAQPTSIAERSAERIGRRAWSTAESEISRTVNRAVLDALRR